MHRQSNYSRHALKMIDQVRILCSLYCAFRHFFRIASLVGCFVGCYCFSHIRLERLVMIVRWVLPRFLMINRVGGGDQPAAGTKRETTQWDGLWYEFWVFGKPDTTFYLSAERWSMLYVFFFNILHPQCRRHLLVLVWDMSWYMLRYSICVYGNLCFKIAM